LNFFVRAHTLIDAYALAQAGFESLKGGRRRVSPGVVRYGGPWGRDRRPPPVCAPDRRPARLLSCLASPRLLASGNHSASPVCLCTPVSCTSQVLLGVPTGGTSYWGHPLGEPNAQRLMSLEIQGISIPPNQQTSSFSNKKMGPCQGRAM
jgi:hypothetical protein